MDRRADSQIKRIVFDWYDNTKRGCVTIQNTNLSDKSPVVQGCRLF